MNPKVGSVAQKSDEFLNTKWAFILFLIGVIIFGIINLILFSLGKISLNSLLFEKLHIGNAQGQLYVNDKFGWIGIVQSFISTIGSSLTMAGVILTARLNRNFIKPLIVGESLIIIDAIIVGSIFTAASYIFMIGAAVYNYINHWKEEQGSPVSKMTSKLWIFLIIFLIIYMLIGLMVEIYLLKPKSLLLVLNASNDIFSSGIVAASWFVVLNKNKKGFLGFLVTDVLYFASFFSLNVYATAISYVIYIFLDAVAYLSWYSMNAPQLETK